MAALLLTGVITGLVIIISLLLNSTTKIFKILRTRPVKKKGAVEIDKKEHIYAHPDHVDKLQDFDSIGVTTLYDVFMRGLKIGGDRPQFSYRLSSDEPFRSYTYK